MFLETAEMLDVCILRMLLHLKYAGERVDIPSSGRVKEKNR
jgi:hypothetical protein